MIIRILQKVLADNKLYKNKDEGQNPLWQTFYTFMQIMKITEETDKDEKDERKQR